jgi:hypothetical protein
MTEEKKQMDLLAYKEQVEAEKAQAIVREAERHARVANNDPAGKGIADNMPRFSQGALDPQSYAAYLQGVQSGVFENLRVKILQYALAVGDDGFTDEEAELYFKARHQTVSSARRDLVLNGWIAKTDKVRQNSSGAEATVWRLATRSEYEAMIIAARKDEIKNRIKRRLAHMTLHQLEGLLISLGGVLPKQADVEGDADTATDQD